MKIKLNDTISIDLQKLVETRLLVQANSGGGKSWAIRRIIEQSFGKVQIIVLDPEGEFTNLRQKFDFVYAGKGGDAPVESRSAALLAHRLLELKASAIIDLYELQPQERKHFVKLFCEAMVNAPKELWHDCLVIIDEAHIFAPEKGESEAMGAVIDLATRGRKRGYCAVLATQRLPKLNKDAAAECNNKLIGRASQDIDRKRAAEELGFSSKDDVRSLRDLDPGEFYAFGPAISREVIKVRIGDVAVKPPPRGTARALKTPPPSSKVRQILAKLKDLPQEAAQEAKTTKELKEALATAHRQIGALERGSKAQVPDPDVIKRLTDKAFDLGVSATETKFKAEIKRLTGLLKQIEKLVIGFDGSFEITIEKPRNLTVSPQLPESRIRLYQPEVATSNDESAMGKGEVVVLNAIASNPNGMTREHITVQTGYKRSTRDAYLQRLFTKGYVGYSGNKISATDNGIEALGSDYQPLPTGQELIDHHLRTLPKGESTLLSMLINNQGEMSRDDLTEGSGFQRSTRDAYLQRLASRQLVTFPSSGVVKVSEFL